MSEKEKSFKNEITSIKQELGEANEQFKVRLIEIENLVKELGESRARLEELSKQITKLQQDHSSLKEFINIDQTELERENERIATINHKYENICHASCQTEKDLFNNNRADHIKRKQLNNYKHNTIKSVKVKIMAKGCTRCSKI